YADPSWPAIEERLAGVEAGFRAHQLPAPLHWAINEEPFERARPVTEATLRHEPDVTAVVCSNDVLAVGALQAAKTLGRRVPEALAIIGFDDFDFASYVDRPRTTVAVPGYDMGRRAAELLLEHFQKGAFAESEVAFPTTLVL